MGPWKDWDLFVLTLGFAYWDMQELEREKRRGEGRGGWWKRWMFGVLASSRAQTLISHFPSCPTIHCPAWNGLCCFHLLHLLMPCPPRWTRKDGWMVSLGSMQERKCSDENHSTDSGPIHQLWCALGGLGKEFPTSPLCFPTGEKLSISRIDNVGSHWLWTFSCWVIAHPWAELPARLISEERWCAVENPPSLLLACIFPMPLEQPSPINPPSWCVIMETMLWTFRTCFLPFTLRTHSDLPVSGLSF